MAVTKEQVSSSLSTTGGRLTQPTSRPPNNSGSRLRINREDTISETNITENRVVLREESRVPAKAFVPNYTELAWVLKWEPSVKYGAVKLPLDKLYNKLNIPNSDRKAIDILTELASIKGQINKDTNTSSLMKNRSVFLPMNSSRLVTLKEFSISRKPIQSTSITYGSKYYQVFSEAFPQFTMTIETVVFADISVRVTSFLDSVIESLSNPMHSSGKLKFYDVFGGGPLIIKGENYTLNITSDGDNRSVYNYTLLPTGYSKARKSDDNNVVVINLAGIIVETSK